ncbi:MAG: adenosine deaminase [Paludibacteraceae bacterium]|nr:adenosine deaminase [Paludibacteraceae bacterium]
MKHLVALIDLHLHLDGSMPLLTARRLAKAQGVKIPETDEELKAMMSLTDDCKDLNDYLARFDLACSLLHTREALDSCAYELLCDLHQQGLIYAEIRFAPQKSCEKGLTQREAVQAVLDGIRRAPIPCGLILSMMRGDDRATHKANLETVRIAKEFLGHGVVAIDLAGAEGLYPTRNFEYAFAEARKNKIPIIIHAGEAAGAESVWEAIQAGAVRIGHGVRGLEDQRVIDELIARGITLELCPTSNIDTGIYKSYADYPLRRLIDSGVKICINTDDMTVSNTDLQKEWKHLIETFQLHEFEIGHMLLNSVNASFAPEPLKRKLRAIVQENYPSTILY